MSCNPNVAVAFYWLPLRRSVRIEGSVEKLSREESKAYFASRPRASQIGALASPQSQVNFKITHIIFDTCHKRVI